MFQKLASALNTAKTVLSSPLLSARHLLSPSHSDEDTPDTPAPMDLLMNVMSVQEALLGAETQAEVDVLAAENDQRREKCVAVLRECVASGEEDAQVATEALMELTYWENFKAQLAAWPDTPHVH
jgi:hypothetical protein